MEDVLIQIWHTIVTNWDVRKEGAQEILAKL
jgi:hypothetical protein